MKKFAWILGIFLVLALFGGRFFYLSQQSKITKNADVVNIGVLLPLSGIVAQDGLDALAGIKIALEEINAQHRFKINLLVEDNKHTAVATLAAFHRTNDKSSALIVFGGVPIAALTPQIKVMPKPTIALVNAENEPIYETPSVFRAWIPVPLQAQAVARFIENTDAKRIAFLKIKATDGDIFGHVLKAQLEKMGKQFLITESFAISDAETRVQVLKILDKKPEIVVVYGYAQGYISALNSLREQGYTGPIITNQNIIMHHHLLANHGAGIYFETPDYDFSKLVAKDPKLADNLYAAFGYESLKILAKVIEKEGSESANMIQGLGALTDFDTGFGKVSYDPQGEIHLPNFVIKQMQPDGTAKIVKEQK